MISKVFEWGISHAAGKGMTAWDVKERLNRLSSEKQRLRILSGACLRAIPDKSSQKDLAVACREFLDIVRIPRGQKNDWHSLLYIVRSAIIHNQVALLSVEFLAALKYVNVALRRVALDALLSFEQPTDPSHFFSQKSLD